MGFVTTSITYPGLDLGFLTVFFMTCSERMTLVLLSLLILLLVSLRDLVCVAAWLLLLFIEFFGFLPDSL